MAFTAVTTTVEAELLYELDEQLTENGLYFEFDDVISETDMEDLAGALVEWVTENLMPYLGANLVFRGVKITNLTTETSSVGEDLLTTPVPGSDTASGLSNNAAFCIQFKTAKRGRSYRGRNYIGGLSTAMRASLNTVTTAFVGHMVSAYNLLLVPDTIPAGWEWVVVSRQLDGVILAEGITTPVQSVGYADRTIDSQRRRLPKGH